MGKTILFTSLSECFNSKTTLQTNLILGAEIKFPVTCNTQGFTCGLNNRGHERPSGITIVWHFDCHTLHGWYP